MIWVPHYSIIQSMTPCPPLIHPSFSPLDPLATIYLFTISIVLLYPESRIVGIIQHLALSDWLLSFGSVL